MKLNRVWTVLLLLFFALAAFAQQSPEEETVWKLEHSYWEDVKTLDLNAYLELWHPNFVGWPSVSAEPQRKDHITDWIQANTSKGLHLKSYRIEPAASQKTGDVIVVHYWATALWVDKNDSGESRTLRIHHTWIKGDKGWQIIAGMSAPDANPKP